MSSLRRRLAIPITLAAIATAIVVDLLILSAVQHQIHGELRLRLERQASLLSSLRLTAGEGIQLRGVAILALRPDGTTRLPYEPWAPSNWAFLDADGKVPDASEFLDVPAVGIRLDHHPTSWNGVLLPDEQAAVIISTATAAALYSEFRIRLILGTAALVIVPLLVTLAVGTFIGSRIRRLTRRITVLTDEEGAALSRARSADELTMLSNELEFANATLARTRDNIERLQQMRSQFLANVSHEVRTPLFALRGYLESLLDGGIDDVKVNRLFVEKAQTNAHRLDALLKDLIEISRIETGDMKMSFRYFAVRSLLNDAYDAHVEQANERKQTLTLKVIEREVLGDRERLLQVLTNLLDNAIAYSPPGSTIELSATEQERTVKIAVSDNGPGIASEHHSRIFERFYRVDPDRSREAGGTGLGLAIVKHIVEAHNAKIILESQLARGSVFSFELQKGT